MGLGMSIEFSLGDLRLVVFEVGFISKKLGMTENSGAEFVVHFPLVFEQRLGNCSTLSSRKQHISMSL